MKQHPCPKFDSCSAPFCPLDLRRAAATTRYREASCVYLRETVKANGSVPEAMQPVMVEAAAAVLAGAEGGVYLCRVLERAALHGSSRSREPLQLRRT